MCPLWCHFCIPPPGRQLETAEADGADGGRAVAEPEVAEGDSDPLADTDERERQAEKAEGEQEGDGGAVMEAAALKQAWQAQAQAGEPEQLPQGHEHANPQLEEPQEVEQNNEVEEEEPVEEQGEVEGQGEVEEQEDVEEQEQEQKCRSSLVCSLRMQARNKQV